MAEGNMKFIKFTVDDVDRFWDSIRKALILSIAPMVKVTNETMLKILCQLYIEQMQCWCFYDDKYDIYGYVVTSLSKEDNTKEDSLVIYAIYLFDSIGRDDIAIWKQAWISLENFAKANGCNKIMAYSKNPNAISIAEKMGCSSEYRFLVKEVI